MLQKNFSLFCSALLFAELFTTGLAFAGAPANWEAHNPIHVHIGNAGTSGPQGYTPNQIRNAYGFNLVTGDGFGQTIAIIDAYGSPSAQSDLDTFSNTFLLPLTTIQIAYPQGNPRKTDSGWALETSLDVQWAHAIAPRAKILLVVAKSASFSDLLAAVDYAVTHGAAQISMSWGGSEFSSEISYDSHFNVAGVSFFASSGDNGTGVIWPSASPYVVAVGGTTLNLDSGGNVLSESAWSGSGGGLSAYEIQPSYQATVQSSGRRGVPDLSYNADPNTGFPVYMSTNYQGRKGWFTVGGTSAGSPQVAAMMALVNQLRTSTISSADAAFYSQVGYRDITSGCNSVTVSSLTCAQTGFDYVTGLGSTLANLLIPALTTY